MFESRILEINRIGEDDVFLVWLVSCLLCIFLFEDAWMHCKIIDFLCSIKM